MTSSIRAIEKPTRKVRALAVRSLLLESFTRKNSPLNKLPIAPRSKSPKSSFINQPCVLFFSQYNKPVDCLTDLILTDIYQRETQWQGVNTKVLF